MVKWRPPVICSHFFQRRLNIKYRKFFKMSFIVIFFIIINSKICAKEEPGGIAASLAKNYVSDCTGVLSSEHLITHLHI